MRKDWFDSLPSAKAVQANPTVDNWYALFKDLVAKKGAKFRHQRDRRHQRRRGARRHLRRGLRQHLHLAQGRRRQVGLFPASPPARRPSSSSTPSSTRKASSIPSTSPRSGDSKEQVFYEGKAGVIPGVAPGSIDVYANKMQKAQGTDIVALPPAKGKAQGLTPFVDVTKEPRGFAISSTSKVKAQAFAILDFMWSPAGLKLAKLGIPGVHYNDDGKQYVLTEKYSEWPIGWFGDSLNGFQPRQAPLSAPHEQVGRRRRRPRQEVHAPGTTTSSCPSSTSPTGTR